MKGQGKRYWRSLEQLAGDPRTRPFLEREFPEGASEPPQGISRRSMLTLVGASLTLAGLTGCRRPEEKIVPYVESPPESVPGVPRRYATTLPAGACAYGLVVESHEGRPTKIEGNELHPGSLGGTSARIQAEILNLYDPDRSKSVLFRTKETGEASPEAATRSWDEFVTAWQGIEAAHLANGGAGLAVLSEPFASPTLARLKSALMERFPAAHWTAFEPLSDENIHHGIEAATGSVRLPVHRIERARVILALDSDFLLTESDSVRLARGFADGRRVLDEAPSMSRLYAVEGIHSLTGANADHRLALASSRIASLVMALAAALRAKGLIIEAPDVAPDEAGEIPEAWLDALADDLLAHPGDTLLIAGSRQPPTVHAAVLALNAALGNIGNTVVYRDAHDAELSDRESLRALLESMRGGGVNTLVILGGNPVYDCPVDLELEQAIRYVETTIQLSSHVDETSRSVDWHIPRAHFLESWSDARSGDGTLSVVQPLILPLFGGKSEVDVLGLLATGEDAPAYDRVRETWSGLLPADRFERSWQQVLHDGLLKDSALPESELAVDGNAIAQLADAGDSSAGDLEIVFQASPAVHDGRYANNGWLQELPDAMTKLTWTNAALMSVATARSLGLANEQMARLRHRGRELELPVWILPGMAENTVGVALGYGRSSAGRAGNATGFNAYLLRTIEAPDFGRGLEVEAGSATHPVAQTQDHWSMEGRPLVREATLREYGEHPRFAREAIELPTERSMWTEHTYTESPQWGMTIDLNACIGCNACVLACQSENNIPVVGPEQVREGREMHWLRVDRYFAGTQTDPDPDVAFLPVPCMQCENAPCEQVCPVAATVHDGEGLNTMVYNRCIGTRYCSNNCPYKVRRFNFFNFTKDTPEILQLANNPDVTVRSRGVMEKCTYCTQRIQAAKIDAKLEGRALRGGEVRTACQQACPTRAIDFGDVLDADSRVASRKAHPRNYTILEELYAKPRTSYLARLRNPNPRLTGEVG